MCTSIVIALAAAAGASASFDIGQICSDVDVSGWPAASTMLAGKHLVLGEAGEWPPFAARDASSASGWSGLDIELIALVAKRLGFTCI